MAESIINFAPYAQAVYYKPTATSTTLALPAGYASAPDLMIINDTDQTVFIEWGKNDVVAIGPTGGISSMPVAAGMSVVVGSKGASHVALVAPVAPTGNVYFMIGQGS